MGSIKFTNKSCTFYVLAIQILVLLLLNFVDYAYSDYENTWNLYYEQPCCMGGNNQHHIRHHKGKFENILCPLLSLIRKSWKF